MSLFTNNKENKNLFFCAHFYCKTANFRNEYLKSSNYLGKKLRNYFCNSIPQICYVLQKKLVQIVSFFSAFWSKVFLNVAFFFSFAEQIFANNHVNRKNKVRKNFFRKYFYYYGNFQDSLFTLK